MTYPNGTTGEILWQNGLEGMGHNDVTLSIAGKSIQFVATHTHTHSQPNGQEISGDGEPSAERLMQIVESDIGVC